MCGIVGITSNKEVTTRIINSLKKLEYRGYDSAGIAISDGNKITVEKKEGKLDVLKNHLKDSNIKGNIGIGHTRWATHGVPNDVNAHPHSDNSEEFAIIHNGIIENYAEIKKDLLEEGYDWRQKDEITRIQGRINDAKKLAKKAGAFEKPDGSWDTTKVQTDKQIKSILFLKNFFILLLLSLILFLLL